MSATADTSSRSSSPETSESLSDEQNHSETLDFSAWCHLSPEPEAEPHVALSKAEDKQDMPRLEEASLRILEEIFQHQSYEYVDFSCHFIPSDDKRVATRTQVKFT